MTDDNYIDLWQHLMYNSKVVYKVVYDQVKFWEDIRVKFVIACNYIDMGVERGRLTG